MSAPAVLLCVVIVLFLIAQIRVGCKAEYDQEGVRVFVRAAGFHICVFPVKKKEKKQKPKKAKKSKKEKKAKEPVPMKERIGGAVGYVQTLLPVVIKAVGYFFKKLQIDTLYLRLVAGAPDPADAATVYGTAVAVLGALWQPLTQAFDVKDGNARVDLDFESDQMTLSAAAALSIRIGQILWLAVYFGIWALVRFLSERKRQKNEKKLRKAV